MTEDAAKNGCVEDIRYRVIDGVALSGRLYRPQSEAEILLIDVHGGAWSQGDRLNNAAIHTYLAAHGIAVFALDFRMAPAYRYPAAMEDVNFGVRWVKANLARLGLTPKVIGGFGTSSGGHQIVLNALRPDHTDFFIPDASLAGFDAGLDFVIACWPILNPLGRYRMAQEKGIENLIEAHQAFWPDEAAMRRANPTLMLERGEAVALPPMLMLQGTIDENIGHEGVDIFAAHYRKAGGVIQLHKFIDQPHAFITQDPAADASIDALEKIRRYVETFRKS